MTVVLVAPVKATVVGWIFDGNCLPVENAILTFKSSNEFWRDGNHYNIDEQELTDSAGKFSIDLYSTKSGSLALATVDVTVEYENTEGNTVYDTFDIVVDETLVDGNNEVNIQSLLAEVSTTIIFGGAQGPIGPQGPQGLPGSAENVFFLSHSVDGPSINITSTGVGIYFVAPDTGDVTVQIPNATGSEEKWKVYKNTTLGNTVSVTTVGGTDLIAGKAIQPILLVNTGLEVIDTGTEYDLLNSTLSDLPEIHVSTSVDGPTYLATEQAVYAVNADTGPITFRLPNASEHPTKLFYIRTTGSNNFATTVDAVGGDLIDGSPTEILEDSQALQVHVDASNDGYYIVADTRDSATSLASQSTGVKTGGVLTTGAGANQYSISDGSAQFVTSTGVKTEIFFTGLINRVPTNLGTALISFVGLNSSGTVIEQTSPFTRLQTRTIAVLGVVIHVDMVNVDNVNNQQQISYNSSSQLYDLANSMGFFNDGGGVLSANGANLTIDKTIGSIFKSGSNYLNDINDPHVISLPALTGLSFQYRFSDGSNGVTGANIDPSNLDDGAGGLTAMTSGLWSVQRIYNFTSNNIKIQRGVAEFPSLNAAVNGIATEAYVVEPSIGANGLLRGWLVVKQGATVLNGADALFLEAPKFPNQTSPGSASTADLQAVYDNSPVNPEILTNTTNGPIAVRRGSAADTDKILAGQNGAGTEIFAVDAIGNITLSGSVDGIDIATDVAANTSHRGLTTNPHSVTKAQVGLTNVTNDAQIPATEKGAVNGVATLDGSSKIPSAQLPTNMMEFQGDWNATTNTPTLADTDTGVLGTVYRVSVAGTVDFGSGNITFALGDWVYNNGTVWQKSIESTLPDTDSLPEGATNLYYTEARVDANTDVAANTSHRGVTTNPHATDIGNLGSGTLAELNTIVSDATLDDSGDSRTPSAHTIASHSDTTATGAELDTLTDGSNADALHVHSGATPTSTISGGVGPTTIVTDTVVETITPGAGTYLVMFSGRAENNNNSGTYSYRIRANAVNDANSERSHLNGGNQWSGANLITHTQAKVTVLAAEAIDVEFTAGVGTTDLNERSLIIIKVA